MENPMLLYKDVRVRIFGSSSQEAKSLHPLQEKVLDKVNSLLVQSLQVQHQWLLRVHPDNPSQELQVTQEEPLTANWQPKKSNLRLSFQSSSCRMTLSRKKDNSISKSSEKSNIFFKLDLLQQTTLLEQKS
jgi:hypothetical protein